MAMKVICLVLCAGLLLAAVPLNPAAVKKAEIVVRADAPGPVVSADLFGVFFEEINHAGETGLYGELLQNRGFEENRLPEGTTLQAGYIETPNGWTHPFDLSDPLPAWEEVRTGSAWGSLAAEEPVPPLHANTPIAMHLQIGGLGTGRYGAANTGGWGIPVTQGAAYDLTFFARCSLDFQGEVRVSLESTAGLVYAQETLTGITDSWQEFQCTFSAAGSDPNARLVICGLSPGSLWLDEFSLFPQSTWKGRANGMRPDLAQRLADLRPGFFRFPGGCFVEGCTLANRYEWKKTLGPLWQRPGHWSLWGYHSTDGLGFHDYLQLCEDLGCEALYVTNCGMSCQYRKGEVVPLGEMGPYIQDALDAIEYANGPTTSTWGAQRAMNGHPEPFDMDYIQVGNENKGADYNARFALYQAAIEAAWPEMKIIACTEVPGVPVEIVDEHYYKTTDWFIREANRFDGYDRNGPKVYVGEYAARYGTGLATLWSALAEGVFVMGMERNADLVIMSSYAPTFLNLNNIKWYPDLICFTADRNVCIPSYYMQKLYSTYRPDFLLSTELRYFYEKSHPGFARIDYKTFGVPEDFHVIAGKKEAGNRIIIKVINLAAIPQESEIRIEGIGHSLLKGHATVLTSADPMDVNDLFVPERVVPVKTAFNAPESDFTYTFPPYSFTVLDLGVKKKLQFRPAQFYPVD